MADSTKTGPTSGDIARLDAKLDLLSAKNSETVFIPDSDTVELYSLDRSIWVPFLKTLRSIENHHKSFNFFDDWRFQATLHEQMHQLEDDDLPALCRLFLNLCLAIHSSVEKVYITRSTLPWHSYLEGAIQAWIDLPDDEKPKGKLLANVCKMLRRLRKQVILGEKGMMTYEERGVAFRERRDALDALLDAEERAIEEKAALENVVEDVDASETEEEDVVCPGQGLEDRRESCISTIEPTPFDSILATPLADDYSSGNSSVGDEDEEKNVAEMAEDDLDLFLSKLALSPHQKWNLETVDLVFEMFKISTDGPVYEDGDLI